MMVPTNKNKNLEMEGGQFENKNAKNRARTLNKRKTVELPALPKKDELPQLKKPAPNPTATETSFMSTDSYFEEDDKLDLAT